MNPQDINIKDYIYDLPDEKIAKYPLKVRDDCKLLIGDSDGVKAETIFRSLPDFLPEDAYLIYNNTRVINARLRFRKKSGGLIEIFCLEPIAPADYEQNFASTAEVTWHCFVGNSKKWKEGALDGILTIGSEQVILTASRTKCDDGSSEVTFAWNNSHITFASIIEAAGEIPIPPYLNRDTEESDTEDYQTVFGRIEGSVAAPTAGLHFTPEVLNAIDRRGITRREVTLHVGAGTFKPVKSEKIGEHPMHSEFIVIDKALIKELANTDRPVYAVGTTSVRTLESLYHIGCLICRGKWDGEVPQWYPYDESHPDLSVKDSLNHVLQHLDQTAKDRLITSTRIIIAPGYRYRIVRGMVTNFHQPGSTLLLLVSAMIGKNWRSIYEHALSHGYRFLSYGDACFFMP